MTSGTSPLPAFAAIIVAAGAGLRAGQPVPKQFARWRGKPVVRHSVEAMVAAGADPVVVCIPEGAERVAREALSGLPVRLVTGGATRQASVLAGLEALVDANKPCVPAKAGTSGLGAQPHEAPAFAGDHNPRSEPNPPDFVLIHDAARPFLPASVIERLLAALADAPGVIPVLPVVDSMVHADGGIMGSPAPREALRRVQTPQAFRFADILAAHRQWQGAADAGDDAQVAQAFGLDVALVEGDEALHKLTFATDFANQPPVRTGTGYDVHRLAEGEELWLCGVKIQHSHGLSGHSDADVAIHALVDALLGAVGAGDIGSHFPPSDPQWQGASSDLFLAHAAEIVVKAGYAIGNIDITIICEAPRIGPHREAMRERLAAILGVDIAAVSVKATTTEGLGFTGRREGIAAQAVASLVLS